MTTYRASLPRSGGRFREEPFHPGRLPAKWRLGRAFSGACRAAVLGSAILAVGCVVDQKKEVATYRKVLDGQKPVAEFQVKPGQPLSLEAALLLANRSNEQLASSGEDYLQALIDRERAFSNFLPTISLAPTYNWQDKRSSFSFSGTGGTGGGTTGGGVKVKQGTFDLPVTGRYNLFNGFQDLSNLQRARYTSEQRQMLLLDLQQTILLQVSQTYYQILVFERQVQVLTNSVAVQNARVQDMQGRQAAGVARPLDVAQTAAQAAATRVTLIQAQNNVRTARQLLALLTSGPVQDSPLEDRIDVPRSLPAVDGLVHDAELTRQDVHAAEAQIEAARQNVQAAIGQYYPSVTLNLDYFLHKDTIPTNSEWAGILNVNLPIFTGGLIHANVRTAWSQLRQAWLNQRLVHRQVAEQVQVAYENLEDSRRRIVELRVQLAAAQEALRQAESAYANGLGTNLDRLTAQDQLLTAQLSLVSEELNFKVFYLDLLREEGRMPLPSTFGPPAGAPTSRPTDIEIQTPGPVRTTR